MYEGIPAHRAHARRRAAATAAPGRPITPRRLAEKRRPTAEPLEGRQLYSVTTLAGTAGDDVFTLTQPLAAADTLVLDGKGGHDKVVVAAAANALVKGRVQLKEPAGGSFDVDVDAHLVTVKRAVEVGHGKIVGALPGTIDLAAAAVRTVKVQLPKPAATNKVFDTPAGSTTELVSGTTGHTVQIGDNGLAAAVKGKVKLTSTVAVNPLATFGFFLNDSADPVARTVTITPTTVTGAFFGGVELAGVTNFGVKTGPAADTVNVEATAASIFLQTAGGTDQVRLGKDGRVDRIAKPVLIANDKVADAITVDNSADTVGRPYQIVNHAVTVGLTKVASFGAATVTLKTGSGNDRVDIDPGSSVNVVVRTGAGDDTVEADAVRGTLDVATGAGRDLVNVGDFLTGRLDRLTQDVTVNAGFDAHDRVQFIDRDTAGHSYTVDNGVLVRRGLAVGFTFAASEFVLAAGSGNDDVFAAGVTDAATEYTYSLGAGNDRFLGGSVREIVSGGFGDDVINPGGGFDTVRADEGNDRVTTGDDGFDEVDGGPGVDLLRCDLSEKTIAGFEGIVLTGSVHGSVFNDKNGNGARDAGEGALPVQSQVFVELDGSPGPTTGDVGVTVRPDGAYDLFDVPLVTNLKVFVRLPSGAVQTAPSPATNGGARLVTLTTGVARITGVDFGAKLIKPALPA